MCVCVCVSARVYLPQHVCAHPCDMTFSLRAYMTITAALCFLQTRCKHQRGSQFHKLPIKKQSPDLYCVSIVETHTHLKMRLPLSLLLWTFPLYMYDSISLKNLSSTPQQFSERVAWVCEQNATFLIGVAVRMILISIIAMTMWTEIIVWLLGCLFYCSSS